MKISEDLKAAIKNLPSSEKDKLIIRLLKKDLTLANRLEFELVSTQTLEERREAVKSDLKVYIDRTTTNYYSIGWLFMDLRSFSGIISNHVSITKDKYGEILLNIWVLTEVIEGNNHKIAQGNYKSASKFCTSVIARTFKILVLLKKIHEDYRIDFDDQLIKLGKLIGNSPYLMQTAIYNGFDVNWLLEPEIPDDIETRFNNAKKIGYLKL